MTLPAGARPPAAVAPPPSTSPRARSSTVLEEDLVAQAQRLRASPPVSPRQPGSSGNDLFDTLFKRAQEVRKSVQCDDEDDDWDE